MSLHKLYKRKSQCCPKYLHKDLIRYISPNNNKFNLPSCLWLRKRNMIQAFTLYYFACIDDFRKIVMILWKKYDFYRKFLKDGTIIFELLFKVYIQLILKIGHNIYMQSIQFNVALWIIEPKNIISQIKIEICLIYKEKLQG